jgi:hypothetical protein
MKKEIRLSVFILAMLLSSTSLLLASDSASIPVSCSIPAVPGLNVPLVEENTQTNKTSDAKEETTVANEEKEMQLSENSSAFTKTLYAR